MSDSEKKEEPSSSPQDILAPPSIPLEYFDDKGELITPPSLDEPTPASTNFESEEASPPIPFSTAPMAPSSVPLSDSKEELILSSFSDQDSKSVSIKFKDRMQAWIKTSDIPLDISEKTLNDPLWEELRFEASHADLIFQKIQLLNKRFACVSLFPNLKEPQTLGQNYISWHTTCYADWQLFLLAGVKLPADREYTPEYFEASINPLLKTFKTATDEYGRNALSYAALGGNEQTFCRLAELLDKDLIKTEDSLGCTPIEYGLMSGLTFHFMVQTQLTLDFIKKRLQQYNLAALFAAVSGNVNTFKTLQDLKTPFNSKNQWGMGILHLAAASGNIKMLEAVGYQEINKPDYKGRTPLHHAAYYGYLPTVQELIKKGALIHAKDYQNRNVFFYAAYSQNSALWGWLLAQNKHQSPLTSCDNNQDNILTFLAGNKRLDFFQYLLASSSYKPSLNHQGRAKNTALHFIAETERVDVAQLLINSGASDSLNLQNNTGQQPLHCAVRAGHTDMVRYLVEQREQYINLRYSHALKFYRPLDLAPTEEMVKQLLQLGADPTIVGSDNKSDAVREAWLKLNSQDIASILAFSTLDDSAIQIVIDYLIGLPNDKKDEGTTEAARGTLVKEAKDAQLQTKREYAQMRRLILSPLLSLADGEQGLSFKAPSADSIKLARNLYIKLSGTKLAGFGEILEAAIKQYTADSQQTGTRYLETIKECLKKFNKTFPSRVLPPTQPEKKINKPSISTPKAAFFSPPPVRTIEDAGTSIRDEIARAKKIQKAMLESDVYTFSQIIAERDIDTPSLVEYYKTAFKNFHACRAIDLDSEKKPKQATINAAVIFSSILNILRDKHAEDSAKKALAIDIALNGISSLQLDGPDILSFIDTIQGKASSYNITVVDSDITTPTA